MIGNQNFLDGLGENKPPPHHVICQCCRHAVPLEKAGDCYRCGNCRCAIDAQGRRFMGQSKLSPSEIPKWGSKNK